MYQCTAYFVNAADVRLGSDNLDCSAVFRDLAAPPQDLSCGPLSSPPCLPSYPSPPHTRPLLVAKRPKNFGLFI